MKKIRRGSMKQHKPNSKNEDGRERTMSDEAMEEDEWYVTNSNEVSEEADKRTEDFVDRYCNGEVGRKKAKED